MQEKSLFVLAAFLTWIAGFVDAVGYISLRHIYTANMSGNSVAIGIEWDSQNWPGMARRVWPVATYVIGLIFCRIMIEFGARERIRSIASIAFLFEIAFLAPALLAHSPAEAIAVGLLAIAMGIQNAALTHFSSLTLHTGFVTGTLLKFAEQFTKYLTWVFDHIRTSPGPLGMIMARSFEQRAFRIALLLALIWIAYVIGAFCGALGDHAYQMKILIIPIGGLAVLTAIDLRWPLAIREEEDQAKLQS